MTTKRDSKRKPKSEKEPKLARPKKVVKDLEAKAGDDDVKGGVRKAGKGQQEYL
jgi:hypothetical protein